MARLMRLHRFVRWAQDRSAAVRLCSRSLALKAAALVPISGDWDGFHQVLMVGKLAGRGERIRQGEKKRELRQVPRTNRQPPPRAVGGKEPTGIDRHCLSFPTIAARWHIALSNLQSITPGNEFRGRLLGGLVARQGDRIASSGAVT